MQRLRQTALGVAVAQSGDTSLMVLDVEEVNRITVEIAVSGQALDAFTIQAKAHPDGSFFTLYSLAADYTSPDGVLVATSGDLTVIAAGASGWFIIDTDGIYALQFLASSGNAAGSTVSVYAGGQ